ncbi:MAG: O-methyltransferase [Thermoplasmata archaeon]|nr:O-methyltransferase [Thermoplasmata archaeon]
MAVEIEAIGTYLDQLLPDRDPLLSRLEAEAREENIPIVGPRVGGLLRLLTSLVGPRRILELGTAVGYSAIWMGRGMPAEGEIVTIEARASMADRARRNLGEAGLGDRVDVRMGEALTLLPQLKGPFELIFNDIDKESYPAVIPWAKALLRPGGLLVTDNVLWSGRVADPSDKDAWTEAIRTYNRSLAEDPEMETVVLPVRDGVSISVKSP